MEFSAQDAYQFHIFLCKLYQHILIDDGNPFIYGFHHFGRFSGLFSMKSDVLVHFEAQNRDAYQFSIVQCQLYQCILIDGEN